MHFNSEFSARQILWTLTFAAQLVLLVVLLGRDRARRYPWFTTGIVLFALQLMAEVLLAGRMAMLPLQITMLALSNIGMIVGMLVVAEVARRTFGGLQRSLWIINVAGLLIVAYAVLVVWGPWPVLKDMALDTTLGKLRLVQLIAQKGNTLVALLTVELGLAVVLFGRHFKAAWRSHTQMIVIGLSTVAMASIAIQEVLRIIVQTVHPKTQQEYDHVFSLTSGLVGKLLNANSLVYLAALLWWIVWLWREEPGTPQAPAAETAQDLGESS